MYETKISTPLWIAYDIPGNVGWILYLIGYDRLLTNQGFSEHMFSSIDWVLLCNNGFPLFSHYYSETKGVYGRHLFGYNWKTHLTHIVPGSRSQL